MIKILLLILPVYIFALSNPYRSLDKNEKLNIMINYFINEEIKKNKPEIPVKRKLKDDGATLDPVKYELYFSYIQRLKAIRESRAEEQKSIDVEYAGKIGFYNGKLKSLKEYYHDKKNLHPILQKSINKAFKVVFGKPIFKDIVYKNDINLLSAKLESLNLYNIDTYNFKELELFVYKGIREDFIENHFLSDIKVRFTYDGKYLFYKDVIFVFKDHEFIGKFINTTNEKIKLDIKINDDIFRPIKIGETTL